MAVLRGYIDRLALVRIGQSNAPLRFYADMLVLELQVRPIIACDLLGTLAVCPAYAFVRNWLTENASLDSTREVFAGRFDLDCLKGTIYALPAAGNAEEGHALG